MNSGYIFMDIVFFILLFLIALAFLIYSPGRKAGLTKWQITIAFGGKVLLGCVYGLLFKKYYDGDDTWLLQEMISKDAKVLSQDPVSFFKEVLPTGYFNEGNFTGNLGNYIWNIENWLIIKPLAILDFLFGTNYYQNIILINTLFICGNFWLFRMINAEFPGRPKIIYAIIFLFPPAVFWLSGLRSDGYLAFFMLGTLYYFNLWLKQTHLKRMLMPAIFLLGVLIFRPQVSFLLIPALIAWYLAEKTSLRSIFAFIIVYGMGLILLIISSFLPGSFNLLNFIVAKQQAFLSLSGNTRFHLPPLEPDIISFVMLTPQALANTFLRPYLWEWTGVLQLITALENIFVMVMLIFAFISLKNTKTTKSNSLIVMLFFFSFSLYLFTGYTVPFPGAIVRYKIVAELFLLTGSTVLISSANRNKFKFL